MADRNADTPRTAQGNAATQAERAERLAAALRANLHRRKARVRAAADGGGDAPAADGDGTGDRQPDGRAADGRATDGRDGRKG